MDALGGVLLLLAMAAWACDALSELADRTDEPEQVLIVVEE